MPKATELPRQPPALHAGPLRFSWSAQEHQPGGKGCHPRGWGMQLASASKSPMGSGWKRPFCILLEICQPVSHSPLQ